MQREKQDKRDFEVILKVFKQHGYQKGVRAIHMALLKENILMNPKKIHRIMKKFGLQGSLRRPNPARQIYRNASKENVKDDYVKRQFKAYGPRKVLLTDITYLKYGRDQKAYMCSIKDAYTNEILSYTISKSLEMPFVIECMNILKDKYNISLTRDTIIHSDQGAHYTSLRFQEIVRSMSLVQSMSRRGNCWDNAPKESYFGTLKDHVVLKNLDTYEQVKAAIIDFVDYYNNDRQQWSLAKLAPTQYYQFYLTGDYPFSHLVKTPELPKVRIREII